VDGQATNSWIGRTLGGRYKILDAIGEGGMGIVYRAQQISVDREVAIKMMHAKVAQDPQWGDRFQSEAKACSMLTHPNTIRLYDFGQTTLGNFYMVMELLRGRSLDDVIQHEAPMDAARVLRILMQCCASLGEAHRVGIIHRDIKPENIILLELEGARDFVKLFDFSIAKRTNVAMTATGIIMGTPQFMSPEQGRGEEIDLRSDLYSLGVVAYAMLSGRLPFNDKDPLEVVRMHQSHPVPPLPTNIPDSVRKLVMSCLDKNPARRPASALALLEACKIWLTKLDPTLDVASDPVLKNTLVTGEPKEMPAPAPTFKRPRTDAKTMLSASGARDVKTGVSPRAPERTPAPAPDVHQKKTVVRDSGVHQAKTVVSDSGARDAKTMMSATEADQKKTMISESGARAKPTDADQQKTMISESGARAKPTDADQKKTMISQSGQRKSQSKSMMATMIHDSGQAPVEPQAQPADRSLPLKAPSDPNKATSISVSQRVRSSQRIQPAASPSSQAVAPGSAPPMQPMAPGSSQHGDVRAETNDMRGPHSAAMQFTAPHPTDPPVMKQTSTAGFLLICVLVAVTFGFGGYFLASTVR
jgi:serine/threonine protein kinase